MGCPLWWQYFAALVPTSGFPRTHWVGIFAKGVLTWNVREVYILTLWESATATFKLCPWHSAADFPLLALAPYDLFASQTGEKAVDDSDPLLAKTFGCAAADVALWWSEWVKGACCEFLFFGHEKLHSWNCTLKRTLEQAKLLRMWIILVYSSSLCRV